MRSAGLSLPDRRGSATTSKGSQSSSAAALDRAALVALIASSPTHGESFRFLGPGRCRTPPENPVRLVQVPVDERADPHLSLSRTHFSLAGRTITHQRHASPRLPGRLSGW